MGMVLDVKWYERIWRWLMRPIYRRRFRAFMRRHVGHDLSQIPDGAEITSVKAFGGTPEKPQKRLFVYR